MLYNYNTAENAKLKQKEAQRDCLDWEDLQREGALADPKWCRSTWLCRGLEERWRKDVTEDSKSQAQREKRVDDPSFWTLSSVLQKYKIWFLDLQDMRLERKTFSPIQRMLHGMRKSFKFNIHSLRNLWGVYLEGQHSQIYIDTQLAVAWVWIWCIQNWR